MAAFPQQVVHRLLPADLLEERRKKSKPLTPTRSMPREDGVKVHGLDDVLIRFARCCHPLPGRQYRRVYYPWAGSHRPHDRLFKRREIGV